MQNKSTELIEIVPNVSEGRDRSKIEKLANCVGGIPCFQLLHVDSSYAANRTVFTFCSNRKSLIEGVSRFIDVAFEVIDMREHHGIHPRVGAVDVMPIIPLKEISLNECVELSRIIAEQIGNQYQLPVYLYGASAMKPDRVRLENIRKGQYERLELKLLDAAWKPDFGLSRFDKKRGAIIVGARNLLIAYNINITAKDRKVAAQIANEIRESSQSQMSMPSVKAIGWYVPEYECAQVSMNLTDYNRIGLADVYKRVGTLAGNYGVEVSGSEIVGLVPKDALLKAGDSFGLTLIKDETTKLDCVINALGLSSQKYFDVKEKVIEYAIIEHGISGE